MEIRCEHLPLIPGPENVQIGRQPLPAIFLEYSQAASTLHVMKSGSIRADERVDWGIADRFSFWLRAFERVTEALHGFSPNTFVFLSVQIAERIQWPIDPELIPVGG